MQKNRILLISQVIPQWYIDMMRSSMPPNSMIDCITGSNITSVNLIAAPVYDSTSFRTKLISWICFTIFLYRWLRKNRRKRYDLIFAVSNPPLNAFTGVKFKKAFNAPFLFMNWDLYPQSIEVVFKNHLIRRVCKIWHKMNNQYYHQIDKMLTIGNVMAETINESLRIPISIKVLPIATDTNKISPINKQDNLFLQKHGLMNKFIVMYSGNMGYGHNIGIILDAAEQLMEFDDIHFVLIGEGPYYKEAEKFIKNSGISNISLFPLQPDEVFRYSVACGDVAIVSEDLNQARLFIPSKTFNSMAAGEAIVGICSEHDDLQSLIDDNDIGIKITNGEASNLSSAILKLYNEPDLLNQKKRNSRNAALNKYSLEIISKEYKTIFEEYLRSE